MVKVIVYPLASACTYMGMHTIYMHIYIHMHALQTHTTHDTHPCTTNTHTHMHTYNPGGLLTCVHVFQHKVRAVSLSSCSNSHLHSALGRKGCSPALVSASLLQEGMAVNPLNVVLSIKEHSFTPSQSLIHCRTSGIKQTWTLNQPCLSCFLP